MISESQMAYRDAKALGTDLVEVSSVSDCCEKCAPYRGRVFSLHGKDKRFPILPKEFKRSCCGLDTYPYTYGISSPTYCKGNIIKFSNRPFIDDRTEEEIQNYQERMKKGQEDWQREKDRKVYEKLLVALPSDCPKSFASFRRMKKTNNETYAELKKKAKTSGVKL